MDKLLRPRNLMILGVAITAAMFYPKAPNVFETPGSKQIGDRWSAAGGKDSHTPGAATRRGDPDHVEPNQVKGGGIDSKHFQERVADQRPGDPGIFDKKWNKAHYDTEKGK